VPPQETTRRILYKNCMPKLTLISYKIRRLFSPFLTRGLIGFYIGVTLSYFLAYFFAGRETYQQGILPSIVFNFSNWQIHLHHWFMSFTLLLLLILPLFMKRKISTPLFLFAFGFSIGLIAQGVISYSDWSSLFVRRII